MDLTEPVAVEAHCGIGMLLRSLLAIHIPWLLGEAGRAMRPLLLLAQSCLLEQVVMLQAPLRVLVELDQVALLEILVALEA